MEGVNYTMDEQLLKALTGLQESINGRFDSIEKSVSALQADIHSLNAKMESYQKENRENFLAVRKELLSIREEHAKFSADLAGAMNIILPVYEQEFSRMDEKLHAVK
uniref:Uncharacterized protein n=2 Tax=unclassified Caudoviricetes TaxID=2788787 RepID=A0A8S5Q8S1_9CAUD|nr:MAG TPA: hypothetical protein [Siphoviridae sp. ctAvK3]DAE15149.1 MAG TPA: hypothetical protein [Siphoviridae sp. ctdVv30]